MEPSLKRMFLSQMSQGGQGQVLSFHICLRNCDVCRRAETFYASYRLVHIKVTSAFPWSEWLKTLKGIRSPIFRKRFDCRIVNS